uniref:Uncharacterized protein n=1 Tax=Arundo donax TaxID=35708 RepID=A0A0A9FMH9_ARUDO
MRGIREMKLGQTRELICGGVSVVVTQAARRRRHSPARDKATSGSAGARRTRERYVAWTECRGCRRRGHGGSARYER